MKGQISVEFLAAGLIFIMGVVFVINVLTGSLPEYLDQKDEESINVEMKRISGHLIKKEGEPGWTSNPNSADNIGLASEYMVLSESKVQSLEDLDYLHFTEAMDLDHTYRFNFTEYPVIDTSNYIIKNSSGSSGSLEVVVAADGTTSYEEEWKSLCDDVNDGLFDELENEGLKLRRSFYSFVRQPQETAGGGTPFSPDCWNEYNSENGGLTEYEGPPLYPEDSSGDDGISVAEAWGPATLWTLTNHDWSNSIDRKALLIFTDVFPTGADGAENDPIQFKDGSCSQQLCTEMDFVEKYHSDGGE